MAGQHPPVGCCLASFRQRDGHAWLLPQNSAFEPILGDYAEILGKVVTVLRSL